MLRHGLKPSGEVGHDAVGKQHAGTSRLEYAGDSLGAQHGQSLGKFDRVEAAMQNADGVKLGSGVGIEIGAAARHIDHPGRQVVASTKVGPEPVIGSKSLWHQGAIAIQMTIEVAGDAVFVEGRRNGIGDRSGIEQGDPDA